MSDKESRIERQQRQAREVEASQRDLRESIAKTQKLLDASENMLKRHREEREREDD